MSKYILQGKNGIIFAIKDQTTSKIRAVQTTMQRSMLPNKICFQTVLLIYWTCCVDEKRHPEDLSNFLYGDFSEVTVTPTMLNDEKLNIGAIYRLENGEDYFNRSLGFTRTYNISILEPIKPKIVSRFLLFLCGPLAPRLPILKTIHDKPFIGYVQCVSYLIHNGQLYEDVKKRNMTLTPQKCGGKRSLPPLKVTINSDIVYRGLYLYHYLIAGCEGGSTVHKYCWNSPSRHCRNLCAMHFQRIKPTVSVVGK